VEDVHPRTRRRPLPDELEPGGMKADGSPNYFMDAARPVPFDLLAQLATSSLRDIFAAKHPGNLAYRAMNATGDSIRFPNLGIRQRVK
jgi:hypothetical protein